MRYFSLRFAELYSQPRGARLELLLWAARAGVSFFGEGFDRLG
jgi:hypothetical protein